MPSVLRNYLQFQTPDAFGGVPGGAVGGGAGGSSSDDELGALIAQMQGMQNTPPPMMSAPRRAPLPQRPQQSLWDMLPQILAGAGDTVNAGAGMRSNSLGQVMGMQRGQRDQAYADEVNQQNVGYQNRMADRQDEMLRYQMKNQSEQQNFGRDSKLAELLMMHKALTDQAQKKNSMRQIFEQGLPATFDETGDAKSLQKAYQDAIEKSGGDPAMMAAAQSAYQKGIQRIAIQQQPGPGQKFLGDLNQATTSEVTPWKGWTVPQQQGAFWTNPWWGAFGPRQQQR